MRLWVGVGDTVLNELERKEQEQKHTGEEFLGEGQVLEANCFQAQEPDCKDVLVL